MKRLFAVILVGASIFLQNTVGFGATEVKVFNYNGGNEMTEIEQMIGHYGDNYINENLDDKTQQILIIATLTANQAYNQIKTQAAYALDNGVSAEEIQETIFHAAPYCGYTKSINAISAVYEVFEERNIELPKSQATVTDDNRYENGLEVQRSIFGPEIGTITDDMSDDQKVITKYLSDICFGDFYTRGCLDVKVRELITLSVLVANGGCESQVTAHTKGNLAVGNSQDMILSSVLLCVPYNGFPRTLNAINAIKSGF